MKDKFNLSGYWSLYLDPKDEGVKCDWPQKLGTRPLSGEVQLPGSIQAQGFGTEPGPDTEWIASHIDTSFSKDPHYVGDDGAFRIPWLLQPQRRYVGVTWFVRQIDVTEEWLGKELLLHLERVHWGSSVWLDAVLQGTRDSLSVPHEYSLGIIGSSVAVGRHSLAIRVDNRLIYNVGPNAHSVSDHTQGNWNGIVGAVELLVRDAVCIEQITFYPDVSRRSAIADIRLGNSGIQTAKVCLEAHSRDLAAPARISDFLVERGGARVQLELRFGDSLAPWDEFSALHDESTGLTSLQFMLKGTEISDVQTLSFGLRSVCVEGQSIHINDQPVFLRGTLECCVFPKTGHPPTDRASWLRIYSRAREYGLNHIRFHSWCPPKAAFEAADEAGFYLQVDCPVWANNGASVGENPDFDQWLYRESERILATYGNHPSFILFCAGNEPAGRTEEFLGQWVEYWKQRDGRRLYTAGAGWPAVAENDYHNVPNPRVQQWGEALGSRINALPPQTISDYREICATLGGAVVSHEIGQWCAFPNFDEIAKYSGPLQARNFELFQNILERAGMGAQARQFLWASGRLQLLCYREEIEASLRTPNLAGFQLLGLTDFPGQGTALVGVLDAFWEDKGYASPDEFREFCGPTVLLARLCRRYYREGERLEAAVELSHFGAEDFCDTEIKWSVVADGESCIASGSLGPIATIERGLSSIGNIACDLAWGSPSLPTRCELCLWIEGCGVANQVTNRWAFWVFPQSVETEASGIHIAHKLDNQARAVLEAGGTVLLFAGPDFNDVAIGFSSVFWNTAWTNGQAPHTLGIVCEPEHPLFGSFPTAGHSDWQWWELIHGSAAMVIDALPGELKPLIQPIDTWFRSHRLALLFEARLSQYGQSHPDSGRIVVCSMDLESKLEERIVARQMRESLLQYMRSDSFEPKISLGWDTLASIFHHND